MSEFTVPTRVVTGTGSISHLPEELEVLGRRPVVVADRGVKDAGLLDDLLRPLARSGIVGILLIDPDPDVAAAEEAAQAARRLTADSVLAIGGGSALGAAKAVAIRLTNPERIDAYQGVGNVPTRPAPTLAVPTTAGSGSEVSQVLVLHEPGRDDELVVRSPGCEPRVAILDAAVLRGLPRNPLLYAALDALSHCIESTWSRRSTFFTEALALRAGQSIIDSLPVALDGVASGANAEGDNDAVLQRLLEASSAANMACGNTGLTLVHALSTAPSVHLPHGLQNGVLLPHVAAFNHEISSPDTVALIDQLPQLYDRVEFSASFEQFGVGADGAEAMVVASTGHPFRLNNARESRDDELRELLAAAGAGERLRP